MTSAPTTVTKPRVLVISLNYHPPKRVQNYVQDLINAGVEVDLLLAEKSSVEDTEIDPRVNLRTVLDVEADLLLRKTEKMIVYVIPGKVLGRIQSLFSDRPLLRPLDKGFGYIRYGQRLVSRAFHHRLFWPAFKMFRPWMMAHKARVVLREIDVAGVDRIVAADTHGMALGWRLAKRYPDIRATTALERKPYIGEEA